MIKIFLTEKKPIEFLYEDHFNQMIRIFLDTNALSEILIETSKLGKDTKLLRKYSHRWMHCFSVYTLYEIYNGDEARWQELLKFVSEIHCVMFLPRNKIVEYEYNRYVGKNTSEKEMYVYLNFDIKDVDSVQKFEKMVSDFCKKEIDNIIHESAVVEYMKQTKIKRTEHEIVKSVLLSLGYELKKKGDYIHFPSIRVFALSVMGRASNTNRKEFWFNDVIDTWISYCMPYVHDVITEKEQKGILEQAKKKIPEIKHLNISILSDFSK